jgi:hypothetical protein
MDTNKGRDAMKENSNLSDSIAALGEQDYGYACSGYRIELYLDPTERAVYLFEHVGSGEPEPAWHGRHHHVCRIPEDAIPESVAEAISAIEGHLEWICDQYQGDHWDGSNYRGRWAEADDHDYDVEIPEIACYWGPADWYGNDTSDVDRLIAEGRSAEDIYEATDSGDRDRGCVRRRDAIEWLTDYAEEARGAQA